MRKLGSIQLKSSSLVETLVATVIIIVVFAIASLSLNNLVQTAAKQQTFGIENEMNRLIYLFQHQLIPQDYEGSFQQWNLRFEVISEENSSFLITAEHQATSLTEKKRSIQKRFHDGRY